MDDGRPTFDEVSQLYIDPIECIDCGACVPVCPVSAIFALDDLPDKWKHFTEINAGRQIHARRVRQTPSSEVRAVTLSAMRLTGSIAREHTCSIPKTTTFRATHGRSGT